MTFSGLETLKQTRLIEKLSKHQILVFTLDDLEKHELLS